MTNQERANLIDTFPLTERERDIVASTEIRIFEETFGGLDTYEAFHSYIEETYPEED